MTGFTIVDPCPPGFTLMIGTCYYWQIKKGVGITYDEAVQHCAEFDSQLIKFSSSQSAMKVFSWMSTSKFLLFF